MPTMASANTTVEKDKNTSQAGGEASKTQEEIEMENKITEYEEVKKRIFGGEGMNTEALLTTIEVRKWMKVALQPSWRVEMNKRPINKSILGIFKTI